jgi:hypothetical protein
VGTIILVLLKKVWVLNESRVYSRTRVVPTSDLTEDQVDKSPQRTYTEFVQYTNGVYNCFDIFEITNIHAVIEPMGTNILVLLKTVHN